MTSPTQFQQIRHWVHELIDLDTDQRSLRLAELRVGDAELADEVARLLARIEPADLLPSAPVVGHQSGLES